MIVMNKSILSHRHDKHLCVYLIHIYHYAEKTYYINIYHYAYTWYIWASMDDKWYAIPHTTMLKKHTTSIYITMPILDTYMSLCLYLIHICHYLKVTLLQYWGNLSLIVDNESNDFMNIIITIAHPKETKIITYYGYYFDSRWLKMWLQAYKYYQ